METFVLDGRRYRLVEVNRAPGKNTIGMVAWRLTLHTPEYPQASELLILYLVFGFWFLVFGFWFLVDV